ncbi:MAG: glycosyltransferase family 9 protein [Oculatellaceae cyanobacterium Prado106]|jgi:ADP-heptose:LPS heptosyltransferase|nr:glycosyltransferase family 9 protein [Oculatellaceae cyanobacterium Prado106]
MVQNSGSSPSLDLNLKKVVVVRSLPGLGDMLCIVPALRSLRSALPDARITLIGLGDRRFLAERYNYYIDEYLDFPGFPGIPECSFDPRSTLKFLVQAQQQEFDLALQMHGNGLHSNSFTLLLGAKLNAGFYLPNHINPSEDGFLPYPEHESEIQRYLHLLKFIGIPLQGDYLEFPLRQTDWQGLEALSQFHQIPSKNYVCLHPGASLNEKRWSTDGFAAVADALAKQGYAIVLTGTSAEAELTHHIAHTMRFPALDLAGKTDLGVLAALVKNARLVICNDTGISHLAAALRTPSVVIFLNTDPQRWAPLDSQRHSVLVNPPTPDAVICAAIAQTQQEAYEANHLSSTLCT